MWNMYSESVLVYIFTVNLVKIFFKYIFNIVLYNHEEILSGVKNLFFRLSLNIGKLENIMQKKNLYSKKAVERYNGNEGIGKKGGKFISCSYMPSANIYHII